MTSGDEFEHQVRGLRVEGDAADRRGGQLLVKVVTEREEKNSIAIVSNNAVSGWMRTFTNPRLCAGIVGRIAFSDVIIETGTDSNGVAHTKRQQAAIG